MVFDRAPDSKEIIDFPGSIGEKGNNNNVVVEEAEKAHFLRVYRRQIRTSDDPFYRRASRVPSTKTYEGYQRIHAPGCVAMP